MAISNGEKKKNRLIVSFEEMLIEFVPSLLVESPRFVKAPVGGAPANVACVITKSGGGLLHQHVLAYPPIQSISTMLLGMLFFWRRRSFKSFTSSNSPLRVEQSVAATHMVFSSTICTVLTGTIT
ncbi:hypothetical protein FRX31_026175 [Thalictrum thalictroides]|uniref:Uncharacterized protein n=1 Tax=Thalictrum thalictroides TaxID=46969 RepID=A0A7J6VI30_THATH|nr:hypothetical protein FRX31_026175 [Thalictrum thalictroides]